MAKKIKMNAFEDPEQAIEDDAAYEHGEPLNLV